MANEKRLLDPDAKFIEKHFTKRLIDAYKLADEVAQSKHDNPHEGGRVKFNHYTEHDHFLRMICNAPTVDAVEVVHGRWIERKEIFYESEGEVDAIGCSECGKSQRKHHRSNYCPNCGAKMDGERKDNEI